MKEKRDMVNVVASHAAKYSKLYNTSNTKRVMAIAEKLLPKLCKEFDVPVEGIIEVRPIKKQTTTGRCWPLDYRGCMHVEIDCRMRDERDIAETLAHEFTHTEQYYQKRLVNIGGPNRRWVDDTGPKEYGKAWTYNAYLNQPWEVEARERAKTFVDKYYPK